MSDAISNGKVVHLHYTMKAVSGKVLDQTGDTPEGYVHGAGAIVPGLERALEGRQAGDRFSVTLEAADAFGPKKRSPGPQKLPRSTFGSGVDLKPGMKFTAEMPGGAPVTLFITKVEKNAVYVDTSHPFAGQRLSYDVTVVSVRDATAKEKREGVVE